MEQRPKGSNSFEVFIKLLVQWLEKSDAHPHLYNLWKEVSKDAADEITIEVFAQVFSSFHVVYQPQNISKIKVEATETSELSNLVTNFSENLIKHEEAASQLYSNKYHWFRSSWLLADLLESCFPDDINPGIVIGNYLKDLFPEDLPKNEETGLRPYLPSVSISHGSQIHQLISEIGEIAVENSGLTQIKQQCLTAIINALLTPGSPLELSSEITLDHLVETATVAPTEIAIAWFRDWLTDELYEQNYSISDHHLGLILDKIKAINDESPDLINTTMSILSCVTDNTSYAITQGQYDKIAQIASGYSEIRRNLFCGVSIIDYFKAYDLFDPLCRDDYKHNDLTFMLSRGQYEFGKLFLGAEENRNLLKDYEQKHDLYLAIFDKAVKEGLPELANSLLSLYLFGRAIFLKGRIPLGKALSTAIQIGLSLPGHKVLEHTISVVVRESEKAFPADPLAAFSRRFLRQYLPKRAQLSLIKGQGTGSRNTETTEQEVEKFITSQLNESRWQKLSQDSRDCLISAEIMWRKTNAEFGWGIKDFSGIVTPCCKAIEQELFIRLNQFFSSDEYGAWVSQTLKKDRPKEATAGWLVQMLRQYPRFTPELQKLMDGLSISAHNNNQLLDYLQTIIYLRNQAAHKDQFGMEKVARFRMLLFQEKVLHVFIDHLD